MRRAQLAGLALLVFGARALADTPGTTQWVLATAKATGRGGEQFVSSLRIANPFPQAATVDLTYLAQSPLVPATDPANPGGLDAMGDNGTAPKVRVTVPAGATFAIEDVVGSTFFGYEAPFGIPAGGIRVDSDLPVSVLSRTYVANALSATGVPGTYGFSIPAQAPGQTVSAGETAWLTYVSSSPRPDSGFRTNLILLNTGSSTAVARVALVKGDGTPAAAPRTYTLGRAASAQQTDLGGSFGVAGAETNLRVEVTVTSGGPVAIGASLIDNAISSIAYVPPVKADAPDDAAYGWVVTQGDPALASAGRLDIVDGAPNFMSGLVVVDCPAGSFVYDILAYGPGSGVPGTNTTFTARAEGGWTFEGSSAESGTWTGTISPRVDGSLSGTLTFTTLASARCAAVTKVFSWSAAKVADFGGTP